MFSKHARKDDPRICACGDVDELNAAIGLIKPHLSDGLICQQLDIIQKSLIKLMGEIATKPEDMTQYEQSSFDKLTSSNVEQIEEWIKKI